MSDVSKVRTKIEALLRKAESTTEEEAFLLYDKAQEFMAKYRIYQAMLNLDWERTDEKMVAAHIPFHPGTPGSGALGSLVLCISRTNHCAPAKVRVFTDGKYGWAFRVFGYESDVRMVEGLYNSIVIQLVMAYKQALKTRPGHIHPRTFRQSYSEGYANRITERLRERVAVVEADASAEVGLVLVSRRERVDAESGVSKPDGATRRSTYNRESHRRGYADGSNANIGDRAIGGARAALVG